MEWISVKDELPEDGDYVLTAQPYKIGGSFLGASGCVINTHIFMLENLEWFNEGTANCDLGISHWMPLPKPPTD